MLAGTENKQSLTSYNFCQNKDPSPRETKFLQLVFMTFLWSFFPIK